MAKRSNLEISTQLVQIANSDAIKANPRFQDQQLLMSMTTNEIILEFGNHMKVIIQYTKLFKIKKIFEK